MSTTVADWTFDNLPTTTGTPVTTSPASAVGAGTANSIGMRTSGPYGTAGAAGNADISFILDGAANNGAGDYSSTGSAGNGNAWKVVGSTGWSNTAALGSQGAQFMVSTVGQSGISLKFDLDPSSGKPPSEVQVQYTTDGTNWNNASTIATGTAGNGTTDSISVATNSSNPNIVSGSYYQIANNADGLFWQNNLTADFSGIAAANNNPNFGVRIVNAATGSAELSVNGGAYTASVGGNWRFDNVQILSNTGAPAAPVVSTNPTNQSVAAGQPVTFTAAASGNPVPTVQWYVGAVGSGTLIGGQTSPTLTFTTSSAASDNGNTYYAVFTNASGSASSTDATLSDPLAAVAITTQPSAQTVASGNTATFTAAATGSPAPTVQWQTSPDGINGWTNVSGATATTYSFATTASQNGTFYRAVFTNSQSPSGVATNAAALTVAGTTLAAWTFSGTQAPSPALASISSNTPGVVVTDGQTSGAPTLQAIGMTESGGTSSNNVDILPTAGTAHASFSESLWRVRGTGTGNNGDTNGWWTLAPQYTQGVEIDLNTTGYTNLNGLSFDWYSTTSGPKDMMVQYNTNTGNAAGWTNLLSTPLVATSNDYYGAASSSPTTTLNLSAITLPANDAAFGIRLVSAYDPNFPSSTEYSSAASNSTTQTQISNTGGNWRFGNFSVTATPAAAAPTITTQPTNVSVPSGNSATFTAAASGYPVPSVQWQFSTNGGTSYTPISGATSTSYTINPAPAGDNGYLYEAVFTNNQGTATTNPAVLTVTTLPVVTKNPLSQTVSAGTTNVTFTAAASGNPAPTVQWEVEARGAASFTPVTGADYSGTTSPTLTILTADEGLTGNQYEAVFTNSSGTATSSAATLTVAGTPIAEWEFTSGLGAPGGTSVAQGTGNAPNPTFGPIGSLATNTPDTALTLGLNNDYTGVEAFPESDIISLRSTVNSSFIEYVWRIRSGNGSGPTGSPGTPEGWSQNAPQYAQGVQFNVDTTGYSDVTLHFDWNQGGISDMQPLYSIDGGQSWTVLPNGLITQAAPSGDYYGITPTTTPTGITVNLQGIAGVNNNPKFELQLVAAYDPSLPLITDGNKILGGGDTSIPHGQYATGIAGPVNAQQVIQFGNDENSTTDVTGGTFTLSYNGVSTAPINFDANAANLAANITTVLDALTVNGVAHYLNGNFTVGQTNPSTLNPERDALGVTASTMTVTFKGALAAISVPTLTANGAGLTGSNPSLIVQNYVNGSANGFSPYVDGGGAWELANISFNGDSSNADGLGVTSQPVSTQVAGGGVATFTASAYSEVTPTVTWQVSIDGGNTWTTATGTTSPVTFTNSASNSYTSTFSYVSHTNLSDSGYQFRAVFSAGASANSNAATLTVVAPVAPTITLQPTAISVLVGDVATDTANATGAPTSTVQWEISSDNGTTWTDIPGATASTLSFTPAAAQNGDLIRAQFFNAVATSGVSTNAVTLSVLSAETNVTNWDFGNSQYNSVAAFDNSPAPSGGAVGVGTAEEVGMNIAYNFNDSASGTDGNGAVADGDITNSASSLNPNFNENTWRIRGGVPSTSGAPAGGTPANGWSNFAPQYSQGLQITVPTSGYNDVYATLDWFSTHSGELDAQEQYTIGGTTVAITDASSANNFNVVTGTSGIDNFATLSAPNSFQFGDEVTVTGLPAPYDGTFQIVSATSTTFSYYTPTLGGSWSGTGSAYVPTWTNLGNPIQNNTTPSGNDDFYGISATAAPVPVIFNLTGIAGVSNNPNFGIRLVNAYDPFLSNTQTLTLGDTNSFALSLNGQTTASIPYSANTATEAANIQSALGALSSVGSPNVSVSYNSAKSNYSITFGNALAVAAQPPISVVNDSSDAIATNYRYANATEVGNPPVPVPYNGSKGNWRFDNIEVHGIAIPPVVTSISPASGPSAGGTSVIINGTNFTGATGVTFGGVAATNVTVNPAGTQITAIDPAGSGTVDVTVITAGGTSATSAADQFTYAASSAVSVTSVVVNGNNAALAGVQRSMVNSLVYTFNQAVNLSATNAFTFAIHAGQSGVLATLNWTAISPDAGGGSTQWAVTFSGAGVSGGSIGDGVYDITLNPTAVTSEASPTATVTARATDTFYRMYGDAQGTQKVNSADYTAFLSTFGLKSTAPGYLAYFADDGTTKIDSADYNAFLGNFGKKLSGFTATI